MKSYNFLFDPARSAEDQVDPSFFTDCKSVLVQIFSGLQDPQALLATGKALSELLPGARILGVTTDGEICGKQVFTETVTVSVTGFADAGLRTAVLPLADGSRATGRALAAKLAGPKTKAMILFADGLTTNGEEFLSGVYEAAPSIPVAGGMAGDNARFQKTLVYCDGVLLESGAAGVAVDSPSLRVHTGYNFNWQPIGKEHIITRAEKNRVYTIDDIPAADFYCRYLGEEVAQRLPATGVEFPLVTERSGVQTARAVLVRHEDRSLSFAGNLEVGERVRFGYGSSEIILAASRRFGRELADHPAETIFVYSCMARRRLMPEAIYREIAPLNLLGSVSGFFSYGEFYHGGESNELLNESMTVLVLSESGDLPKRREEAADYAPVNEEHAVTLGALYHLLDATTREFTRESREMETRIAEEKSLRQRQEGLLMQQSRNIAMGEMISNIAHQWRQPLNALGLMVQDITDAYDFNELTPDYLEKLTTDAMDHIRHMSDTIDVFRDFFRPDKQKSLFAPLTSVENALALMEGAVNAHQITVEKSFAPEAENVKVLGYPGEFSQAVLNILGNAKDIFVERETKNRTIRISAVLDADRLELAVEDNGGGMEPEVLPHVFDPYYTTKSQAHGTGIGLYMTRMIVERNMGGEIEAVNGDEGARFVIRLPLVNTD